DRIPDDFPHLEGHRPRVRLLVLPQDFREARQIAAAFLRRESGPRAERFAGLLDLREDLCRRRDRVRREGLARRGIDHLERSTARSGAAAGSALGNGHGGSSVAPTAPARNSLYGPEAGVTVRSRPLSKEVS